MSELVVKGVRTLALVQDLGRPGHRHLGVPPSGAADRRSLAIGNRLLGNEPHAAGVEALLGGLSLRSTGPAIVAVTGAPAPVRIAGRPAPLGQPLALATDDVLEIGTAVDGLRTYLTVRGGIVESDSAPRVLDSLSSDPTSSLGPAPLAEGVRLRVGSPHHEPYLGLPVAPVSIPVAGITLRASWGPRADWLTDGARAGLRVAQWTVSGQTDRVGVRLEGAALELARDDQLPSEGLLRGSVQIPPDGQPIVFLADHPTTGGYPVVLVIDDGDTDLLAQAPPGTVVRLQIT